MARKKVGQAYGLVWTPGGSSLIQIKTKVRKGRGTLTIEGDIGHEFMVAIETAYNLLDHTNEVELSAYNITCTVPGPVDGASAALPLYLSLYSAITETPLAQDMAFTGALSYTGGVLAVDKITEKIEAASRAGMKGIAMPLDNLPELTPLSDSSTWGKLYVCPLARAFEAVTIFCHSEEHKLELIRGRI